MTLRGGRLGPVAPFVIPGGGHAQPFAHRRDRVRVLARVGPGVPLRLDELILVAHRYPRRDEGRGFSQELLLQTQLADFLLQLS